MEKTTDFDIMSYWFRHYLRATNWFYSFPTMIFQLFFNVKPLYSCLTLSIVRSSAVMACAISVSAPDSLHSTPSQFTPTNSHLHINILEYNTPTPDSRRTFCSIYSSGGTDTSVSCTLTVEAKSVQDCLFPHIVCLQWLRYPDCVCILFFMYFQFKKFRFGNSA